MNILKLSRKELKALEGKYIFHGSPILFDVCKPHKATCKTGNLDNEKNAVYGALELDFALVFAFEKLPSDNNHWRVVHIGGKCVAELDKDTRIAEDAKGYLYCFNKNGFKPTAKGSRQYVCQEAIAPEIIAQVEYKDYQDLFVGVDFLKDMVK